MPSTASRARPTNASSAGRIAWRSVSNRSMSIALRASPVSGASFSAAWARASCSDSSASRSAARSAQSNAPSGRAGFPPTVPSDQAKSIAAPRDRCRPSAAELRRAGRTSARDPAARCARNARTTAKARAPAVKYAIGNPPATCTGKEPSCQGTRASRFATKPARGSSVGTSTAISSSAVPPAI